MVMDQQISLTYILAFSIVIQISAAIMAFRLIAITGRRMAWIFISMALALMAVRRIIPLYHLLSGSIPISSDPLNEFIGLILSLLMIVGIALISPIFIERKSAEESLKESEEKMRLLSATAADPIVMIDDEGAIAYWNPAAERTFGYQAQEVMGKSLHLLLAPKRYHDAFRSGFARYRETGNGPAIGRTLEMGAVRKDGTEVPVEVSFSTMVLKEKRHAIGIIRDINERKQLEEERIKIEEQLRQAQKMEAVGQLAGGIAHDFNNILTAIIGFSTLMKMKLADDDPLHMEIDQILASSDRAANLTRSMLAFCRRQIMTPRPTDLNDIIREGNIFLQRVISEDVELRTALADAPLNIFADSAQIEQVLMNLATNARDAMPHGGTLVMETSSTMIDDHFISTNGYGKNGMYAMITVADTGSGMDEETSRRIFEPFFTTKEVGKGTGLGLSVVYGIVKQHEGYIICDSEPGRGTTFRIYLPILDEEVEKSMTAPDVALPTGTETILLAEDDAQVRSPSKLFLEKFGYRVIEAANGEDAVTQFITHKDEISLALLDVIMPRLNGWEAYGHIRQMKPGIKVIFLSGYTAEIFRKEKIAGEGINILLKPTLHKELLVSIRKLLDS
jgi:two-component system, cell cycle sensor histidine kinase and response regulator CckA